MGSGPDEVSELPAPKTSPPGAPPAPVQRPGVITRDLRGKMGVELQGGRFGVITDLLAGLVDQLDKDAMTAKP